MLQLPKYSPNNASRTGKGAIAIADVMTKYGKLNRRLNPATMAIPPPPPITMLPGILIASNKAM
jgi:hypothetical protein